MEISNTEKAANLINTQKLSSKDEIFLDWSIDYSIKLKSSKKEKNIPPSSSDDNLIGVGVPDSEFENPGSEASRYDPDIKVILRNIQGFASPKEVVAIMGPSGCGKTSLLNIIAQRQLPTENNHKIIREVKANGISMTQHNFGKICAYIMQEDILLDCFTPRESLYFSAKLKLNESSEKIKKRVEKLIYQLGLEKCADTKIGSVEKKGISGGERKRTAIAYEIVSNPPVIIIDEPTTGMDSFTSLVIIKHLKLLALTGKTIVCSIHQPSSEIFHFLDRVILLKDGYLVYQGKAQLSLDYFKEIGFTIPDYVNPFDFFLEILSDPNNTVQSMNTHYMKLCEAEVRDERKTLHDMYKDKEIASLAHNLRQVSWCYEFYLLLHRTFINYIRNRSLIVARAANCIFNTLIIMVFYWRIGEEEKKNNLFTNFIGFFFNAVNQFFINGMYTSLFLIPVLIQVLKRETSAKLYRISTFYIALIIVILLNSIMYAVVFSPVTYFSVGLLDTFPPFLNYFALAFFTFTLGQYFGIFVGGSFPANLTFILTPLFTIIFFLGAGVYRNNDSIPNFIAWLFYTSPYKYLLELHYKNEASFKPGVTDIITTELGFTRGEDNCIYILLGTTALILILSFLGIRRYATKF